MNSQAKKYTVYDEFLALSDHQVGEIIAGELITSPRPGPRHARASSILGGEITGPFDKGKSGPGGWWILDEPELHLSADIIVPDLAGWRKDKLPVLPIDKPYFEVAPDWICEVLSEKTARLDRVKKLPIYAKEKVSHAWLIDPVAKTLEIFRLETSGWLLLKTVSGDDRIRAEPFDAIEIELGALWLPD